MLQKHQCALNIYIAFLEQFTGLCNRVTRADIQFNMSTKVDTHLTGRDIQDNTRDISITNED